MNNNTFQPGRNFVAIDVEYADAEQNICQVGLAVVRDLEVISNPSWLIMPPCNYFEEGPMRKHHVTPDDTANAGDFELVWQEIQPCILTEQLWAHNATGTEQPVLIKNLGMYGINTDWLDIHDSRDLFQRPDCPPKSGDTLQLCCLALGIPFDECQHHDAAYDALKCAELVIAYAKGLRPDWTGVPASMEQLRKQRQEKRVLHLGEVSAYYAGRQSGEEDALLEVTSTRPGAVPQIIDLFDKGDPLSAGKSNGIVEFSRLKMGTGNPLYGKTVVLTGEFDIARDELKRAFKEMGAKRTQSISGKTDVVVVGTRHVGYTKFIDIEEQEQKGHHIARVIGDADLDVLLYGDGHVFFAD